MNYRGKDKLAEALKGGLLKAPVQKQVTPEDTVVINPDVSIRKTVADISGVSEALKPRKPLWKQKLDEAERLDELSKKTLGNYIDASSEDAASTAADLKYAASDKDHYEMTKHTGKRLNGIKAATRRLTKEDKKIFEGFKPEKTVDHAKVEAPTNAVSEAVSRQAKANNRGYRAPLQESLEDKVARLEKQLNEYEENEDGRGRHKVNYVHPDKKNIGNDRFYTRAEANRYAASLKKKGYHNVSVTEETEQLDEGRPSQRHPLEGHEYHRKSDAELEYIGRDAHKAAQAMKDHNPQAEGKYLDQANDAATVRYFRKQNGMPEWYRKKYGHIKEEVEQLDELSPATVDRYRVKAMQDLHDRRDKFSATQKQHWTAKNRYKDKSKNKNEVDALASDLDKQGKKIRSRQDGVSRAYSKLKEELSEEKVHFSGPIQHGHTFEVVDSKHTGPNQDKYHMRIRRKDNGKVVDIGSHPSLKGATEGFYKNRKDTMMDYIGGYKSKAELHEAIINEDAEPKHKFNKILAQHGYKYVGTHKEKSLGGREHDFDSHNYEHPKTGSKVSVWYGNHFLARHKQKNGITAPSSGDTKPSLHKNLTRWAEYHGVNEEQLIEAIQFGKMDKYVRKPTDDKNKAHTEPHKGSHDAKVDPGYEASKKRFKKVVRLEKQLDESSADFWKKSEKRDKIHKKNIGNIPSDELFDAMFKDNRTKQIKRLDRSLKTHSSKITSQKKRQRNFREEVEQLDEISQKSLDSYNEKAWRNKIEAHFDKGAAEVYKDGPAYEKSSKTIGKREHGLALAKKALLKKVKRDA